MGLLCCYFVELVLLVAYQPNAWYRKAVFAPVKKLAGKTVSEMAYKCVEWDVKHYTMLLITQKSVVKVLTSSYNDT